VQGVQIRSKAFRKTGSMGKCGLSAGQEIGGEQDIFESHSFCGLVGGLFCLFRG
jgi:hypothetical protein